MSERNFEIQSEILVGLLMQHRNLSREVAIKVWFNSKTYKEILRRGLTFMSATCAYSELVMELNNNPRWMKGVYL